MDLEEGQNILCTVIKIEKTTVFVKLEDGREATIVTSEIAPGRIRNLRDYVVPNKKIVCKILKIDESGNINLSLRRVSEKERKEVLEKYEKEKNSLSILKSIVKERAEEIGREIKKKEKSLYDFLQNCKEKPELLEKYLGKEEIEKICKILKEKKEKQIEVKKEFSLRSNLPDGITKIKNILLPYKDSITYIAAGKFLLKIRSENYKKANLQVQKILQEIENNARKEKVDFEASKS